MRGTARVDPRSSTDARKHLTPLLQKAKQKSPNDMNLRQLQTSFVATNAMLTSDMDEDDLDTFKPLQHLSYLEGTVPSCVRHRSV